MFCEMKSRNFPKCFILYIDIHYIVYILNTFYIIYYISHIFIELIITVSERVIEIERWKEKAKPMLFKCPCTVYSAYTVVMLTKYTVKYVNVKHFSREERETHCEDSQ